MFWFLVSFVLLIAFLNQRQATKDAYQKGFTDGRQAAASDYSRIDADSQPLPELGPSSIATALNEVDEPSSIEQSERPNYAAESTESGFSFSAIEEDPEPIVKSAAEIEAEREQQTIKNLNIMLYVGSFLIVAAAGLFVNLTMPAAVKLTGLVAMTAAFYIAGLVLHARSQRLRAAALAFVGTGLAILPFVGFALTNLGGLSGQTAWWITSLVGLAAYGVAAVRLQSQLVSYLTMAFVLSLALSSVSTLGLAMVWYFIVIIGVSLVCNSLNFLWPRFVPGVFAQPVEQTGKLATPVALGASLLVMSEMDLFMYQVLYGIAALHYVVLWLQTRVVWYELAARALGHIALLLVAWDVSIQNDSQLTLAVAWLALAVGQVIYSIVRVRPVYGSSLQRESVALVVAFSLMLINISLWIGVSDGFWWLSLNLAAICVSSAVVAWRLKQVGWLYIGLLASVPLVLVVTRLAIQPAISLQVIAGAFAAAAAVAVVALERARSTGRSEQRQLFYAAATMFYTTAVVLCGLWTGEAMVIGWTMLVAAALLGILSYLVQPVAAVMVEVTAAVLGVISVAAWTTWALDDSSHWRVVVVVVVSTVLLLVAAYMHHASQQYNRRNAIVIVAAIVFMGLLFAAGAGQAVMRTAVALLIVGGVAALAVRLRASRQSRIGQVAMVGYLAYPALALALSIALGGGWSALALAAMTAMLWAASHIEHVPRLMLAGNVLLIITLNVIWSWLRFDESWRWYGITWLAAAIYYAMYWLAHNNGDADRRQMALGSILVVLVIAVLRGFTEIDQTLVVSAACSLLAIAGVVGIHGVITRQRAYVEASIYLATAGLQRLASLALPEANMVLYGHWWAIVIAAVALWRRNDHEIDFAKRIMVALAFVTASTGLYALDAGGGYTLLFLIEHLVIGIAGAVLRMQWMLWWGVIATVLAILYFLRDYTALALLFLGFLLILFVVWRLLKVGDKGVNNKGEG